MKRNKNLLSLHNETPLMFWYILKVTTHCLPLNKLLQIILVHPKRFRKEQKH